MTLLGSSNSGLSDATVSTQGVLGYHIVAVGFKSINTQMLFKASSIFLDREGLCFVKKLEFCPQKDEYEYRLSRIALFF